MPAWAAGGLPRNDGWSTNAAAPAVARQVVAFIATSPNRGGRKVRSRPLHWPRLHIPREGQGCPGGRQRTTWPERGERSGEGHQRGRKVAASANAPHLNRGVYR